MSSNWIKFVKAYQDHHKCTYMEAMKKSAPLYNLAKRMNFQVQGGGDIFGDAFGGWKQLFTNPAKVFKSAKYTYSKPDFNPITGKYGIPGAVKAWVDPKDPMHKRVHEYSAPVIKGFKTVAKLDPTGVAGKAVGAVAFDGSGMKPKRGRPRKVYKATPKKKH